jgi:hypothetical protein
MLNFLHKNGFTVAIPDNDKFVKLLNDTSFKFEEDNTITNDLEEYLLNYLEKL